MSRVVKSETGAISRFQGEDTERLVAEYKAGGGKIYKCRTAVAADYQARGFHQCRMARRG